MTRDELAAVTDEQILSRYRQKHGDPYMPLSVAKEMRKIELKYWHLGARARARSLGIPLPEDDPAWQEEIRAAKKRVAEHEAQCTAGECVCAPEPTDGAQQ